MYISVTLWIPAYAGMTARVRGANYFAASEKSRRGAFHSAHRTGQPAEAPGIAQARKARSKGRFLV